MSRVSRIRKDLLDMISLIEREGLRSGKDTMERLQQVLQRDVAREAKARRLPKEVAILEEEE